MVFITTATGQIGAVAARALAARGVAVRGGSRDPKRVAIDGVQGVRFDFADPSTFGPALDGVSSVFIVAPPGFADVFSLVGPFMRAAVERNLRIVTMTASGVEYVAEAPMRQLELLAERTTGGWVHIRPTWFSQNFQTFWLPGILAAGVIAVPAADARTAFIDTRDIGEVAAAVLANTSLAGQALTLTGPEALTYTEAADVLTKVSGRAVTYNAIDDASFEQGLVSFGVPADYAQLMVMLFQAVRAGGAATVTQTVEQLLGRAPRSLQQYATEYASIWAEATAAAK